MTMLTMPLNTHVAWDALMASMDTGILPSMVRIGEVLIGADTIVGTTHGATHTMDGMVDGMTHGIMAIMDGAIHITDGLVDGIRQIGTTGITGQQVHEITPQQLAVTLPLLVICPSDVEEHSELHKMISATQNHDGLENVAIQTMT